MPRPPVIASGQEDSTLEEIEDVLALLAERRAQGDAAGVRHSEAILQLADNLARVPALVIPCFQGEVIPGQRYVDTALQGDYFYDLYGSFVTRGWLIYDWRQERPRQFGSSILKTRRFSQFFSSVVISSTHEGIVAAYGHRPAEIVACCSIGRVGWIMPGVF